MGTQKTGLNETVYAQKYLLNRSFVTVRNTFNFWSVHGIMNISGLLQSKCSPMVFMFTLKETRCVHDSMSDRKLNLLLMFTFYIITQVSLFNYHLLWLVFRLF